MDEIITSFKASRSWDEIGVTYGSSGNLYTRIRQGAPFDTFFSADVGFANALNDKGLAATAPKLYAVGRIVPWSSVRDSDSRSRHRKSEAHQANEYDVSGDRLGNQSRSKKRHIFIFDLRFDHYLRLENICPYTQFGDGCRRYSPVAVFPPPSV